MPITITDVVAHRRSVSDLRFARRIGCAERAARLLGRLRHPQDRRPERARRARDHLHDRPRERALCRRGRGPSPDGRRPDARGRSSRTSPRSGTSSSATASCAGSAPRRGSSTSPRPRSSTPSGICTRKSEGKPLWKLLVDMSPEELVRVVPFRYITDALTPDEALDILRRQVPGRGRPRGRDARPTAIPPTRPRRAGSATPTRRSAGCVATAWPRAGGTSRSRSGSTSPPTSAASRSCARRSARTGVLMVDANQAWDVDQAIEWMQALAPFRPWWIEEPTSPDDILGHARIARALAAAGIRVATGEHGHNRVMFKQFLQAGAIGYLPDRQLPARRRQRGARRAADGRQVRRPGLPARRRRRPLRVRPASRDLRLRRASAARSRTGSWSTWTTCTSTSSTPAVVRDGRYVAPTLPGYSITMRPESLARYAFPDGEAWSPAVGRPERG